MKKYIITLKEEDNGTTTLHRTNDGFNPLELLGLMELIQSEAIEQMAGKIKPDVIKRQVIEPAAPE